MSQAMHTPFPAALAGKYLTFQLGAEEFAIRVTQVREILGVQEMTAVPQTPPCLKGVIHLRARVVPVVSLRLMSGLAEEEYTQRTCILAADLPGGNGVITVGMIVDGVSEVVSLRPDEIEAPPDLHRGQAAPYPLALAKHKNRVLILPDLNRVLTATEAVSREELLPQVA